MVRKVKLEDKDIKAEKSTDSKLPENHAEEVTDPELKELCTIPGIGAVTAGKLRDLGYKTILDLATARADALGQELGITYVKAKAWVQVAQERAMGTMTLKKAVDADSERKSIQKCLMLGSDEVNNLLGGGVKTMSITGLTGRFASGKTQICNELIVDCIGRLKEYAVFIETEPDTYHLERLQEIAKAKNLVCDWNKLYVVTADQVPTIKGQYLYYKVIQRELEKGMPIRLVVIDSFNAKLRAGWSRSEMLPIRTRELAEHFNLIEFLVAKYNMAWVLTTQAIAPPRPDQGLGAMVKFGDTYYPCGGDLLLHSVNQWVGLTQIKSDVWVAVLFDSSYLPRAKAEFSISARGIIHNVR